MQVRWFVVLLVLVLAACGETEAPMRGDRDRQGTRDHRAPLDRRAQAERSFVLSTEMSPSLHHGMRAKRAHSQRLRDQSGGAFTFDTESKGTFRPPRQGVAVKVVLACVQK